MSGYYERLREIADEKGFDGCTMATGARKDCCAEHDFHYRYHIRLSGEPITRKEADDILLRCMQRRGWFGWWSPVAWGRFVAVRLFGAKAWEKD